MYLHINQSLRSQIVYNSSKICLFHSLYVLNISHDTKISRHHVVKFYKDGMGIKFSRISYISEKCVLLFQIHLMQLENNAFLYNVEETLYLQLRTATTLYFHYAVIKI